MISIALVGLPGSGKTTIGRLLARRLRMPFVDSDHVIEEQLGCSIRSYFEAEGEAAFREVEAQVLRRIAEAEPCVLSTGGGIVLRSDNRECLRSHCRVVYLHATAQDLYQRLRHDTKRPLLQVEDPLDRLRTLYAQRAPLYRECAHITVDTGRPKIHMVVNAIAGRLRSAGTGGGLKLAP